MCSKLRETNLLKINSIIKEKIIMAKVELTAKSMEVFNYLKDNGGKISIQELADALREGKVRSVSANVNDLAKKGLVTREKEVVEGVEKPVPYAVLTADAGEIEVALKEGKK
jgi:predicted transcriptional regulator